MPGRVRLLPSSRQDISGEKMQQQNYILVGPPGSGKGTQAEKLADYFKLPHISTGDIFREIQTQDSELGRRVKGLLDQGKLVDDETVHEVVLQKLHTPELKKGFVFDGFPRTIDQAEFLDKYRQLTKCVFLEASEEECTKRMASRMTCSGCKSNYNLIYIKPKKEGLCDKCGGNLVLRADSTPQAIKKRLEEYHLKTESLRDYYKQKGILLPVNGEQPIEKVFSDVLKGLK
jgi:adenylate kinase